MSGAGTLGTCGLGAGSDSVEVGTGSWRTSVVVEVLVEVLVVVVVVFVVVEVGSISTLPTGSGSKLVPVGAGDAAPCRRTGRIAALLTCGPRPRFLGCNSFLTGRPLTMVLTAGWRVGSGGLVGSWEKRGQILLEGGTGLNRWMEVR